STSIQPARFASAERRCCRKKRPSPSQPRADIGLAQLMAPSARSDSCGRMLIVKVRVDDSGQTVVTSSWIVAWAPSLKILAARDLIAAYAAVSQEGKRLTLWLWVRGR